MRHIVAITTIYNGRTSYVSGLFNRFDKTITVELSINQNEAKDFLTNKSAEDTVSKIYNPFDRIYSVEKLTIMQLKPFTNGQTQSWLEARVMK